MKRKKKLVSVVLLLILVLSMGMQVVRASTQTDGSQDQAVEDSKQTQLADKQAQQTVGDSEKKSEQANQEKPKTADSKQAQVAETDNATTQPVKEKQAKVASGNSKIALDDQYEWTEVTKNPQGEIAQKDGNTLVYGFDGASKANFGVSGIKFGKPNVYVKTADGKTIYSIYNGNSTLNTTSGLMFIENTTSTNDMLGSSSYRKNLKVMTATDENGHLIIRATMTSNYSKHDWEINAVLRTSADGESVQEEYYLTNLGEEKQISFGKNINSAFTQQPILALGDNKGMSVLDGQGHKFNYTTDIEDGPENWNIGAYSNELLSNFAPKDWTGQGVEVENPVKESVIGENSDFGLKFKWQPRTVKPNETTHIRLDIRYEAHENQVDDMYDWTEVTKNTHGEIMQPNGDTLAYGFDGILKTGVLVGNIALGKPNVYLKTATGAIQHLYQGESGMGTSSGLLFVDNTTVVNDLLTDNSKRTNPKIMTAIDENGHTVIRANVISSATSHDWEVDEILKPSVDGRSVQHEYYLTNLGKEKKVSLGRAVDTKLASNDSVPIRAIGKNRGMFIDSGKYRLYYSTDVKDGPENWNGNSYSNDFLSNFTPADWTGLGIETEFLPANAIIADHIDTGLKLKWQPKDLKLDETAHYRYDVGIVSIGQPMPLLKKSVENISSDNSSEARVGDKLRYTINLANTGEGTWDEVKVTDALPEAVDHPENVVITHANGETETLPIEDVYNEETRTFTLENQKLETDQEITLTFDVEVVKGDVSKVVNVASGTGTGADGKTYMASDDISINVKDSAIPQVEKTVKNVNGSDEYLPGDTVQYSLKVKNANANFKSSWENILIQDAVPEDVTVDTASFHKTYTKTDGTKEESDLAKDIVWEESTNQLKVNQAELRGTEEAVVTFKAKIKDSVANKLVQNKVEAISDEFEPFTAEASFNVAGQLEFISAPKSISFGKLPINSFDKTYKPKTWDQALQVKDSRSLTIAPKWSMLAKLEKTLTGNASAETMTGLYYQADGERQMITEDDAAQVYVHSTTDSDQVTISDLWDDDTGLRLDVPAGKAKKDVYSGTLVWTLQDVPASE